MKFQLDHISSLFKYTGISFTAGSVTHGFFSEERSIWTAIIGIVLYLIGGSLAKFSHPQESQSWAGVILIGIFASIGLGFFTGGLQHFPDSPDRSVWVVPMGFLISLIAVYLMEGRGVVSAKSTIIYASIGGLLVTGASIYAHNYYEDHGHANSHYSGDRSTMDEKRHQHGGQGHKH
jgi:hypothetical protein